MQWSESRGARKTAQTTKGPSQMSTRSVSFGFYRVSMRSDGGKSFDKVLTNIISLADKDRNDAMLNQHYCRLRIAEKNKNIWYGELIQIRMSDLPSKASLKGQYGPLDLEDDQGLGLGVVFMYDSRKNIFLFQRNQLAVSVSACARYFSNKGKCGEVKLEPILSTTAWNRFVALRKHAKLHVKFSGIDKASVFKGRNHGVADIASLSEKIAAPTLELTASIGHFRNEKLNWKGVTDFVNELRGMPRKDQVLTKLTVSGKTNEDQSDEIDLLEEYIAETVSINELESVEVDERRTLSYESRRSALLRAWERREEELETMFNSVGEELDGAQA